MKKSDFDYPGMMKVAILHFHLRRGGVTSVMLKQATCLATTTQPPQLAFIVGATEVESPPVPVFVVPELDYDSFSGIHKVDLMAGAERLAKAIAAALGQAFPKGCDLLHVHNPLLCKNVHLLGALALLKSWGLPLLVQVHDLAEDFRPEVYDSLWPYPESCDYAVINQRDRNHLVAAGLEPDHVHLLPNPVSFVEDFDPRGPYEQEIRLGRTLALYPVRAIGRKNIGEAILLSRFLPEGTSMAVTLPPTSRGEMQRYNHWVSLAQTGSYPIAFEVGVGATLSGLYDTAFCVVTTSVKEGFGYAYLDPLIRGVPVVGREIPHIVKDFADKGIGFTGLYQRIEIPRSSLPMSALRQTANARIAVFRDSYGASFAGLDGSERLESILQGLATRFEQEELDFGCLSADLQGQVLNRIQTDPGYAHLIEETNPFVKSVFEGITTEAEALRLRTAVLGGYGEREYGQSLLTAYETTLARTARGAIEKAELVANYLKPSAFFLVAS